MFVAVLAQPSVSGAVGQTGFKSGEVVAGMGKGGKQGVAWAAGGQGDGEGVAGRWLGDDRGEASRPEHCGQACTREDEAASVHAAYLIT